MSGVFTTLTVGVDPGVHGAIAFVRTRRGSKPELVEVHDLPVVIINHKHELLMAQVVSLFSLVPEVPKFNRTVLIEQVHAAPRQGVSSMFRFGFAAGAVEGIATALGLTVQKIAPLTWQQIVQCKAGPEAARYRAQQLFPQQAKQFMLKKDGNKAAAALIALSGALTEMRQGNVASSD